MKNISLTIQLKKIGNVIYRYNLVIFIVLVAGGLISSILILNNIITQPNTSSTTITSTNTTSTSTNTSVDQQTANRLLKLENSTNNTSYKTLPSGRTNPFGE